MHLLLDIGKTKTRVAVSKNLQKFEEPRIIDTSASFDDGLELLKSVSSELSAGEKIEAVVGGIGEPLDERKTTIARATSNLHLKDWVGKPLKDELEKSFMAPVFLENDCVLVGLGEAVYGAGKGYGIVAYITISTGVGGARIVNGRPDESAMGFEPGHQIIDFNGSFCISCKAPGHLEVYISGAAFEERYGKKPYEVLDEKIWDEAARILACGLNNTIVHWSPDIVVLGGSMMKKIGIPIERVRFHLANVLKIFPKLPVVEKAVLGDIGGLYGAMAYLFLLTSEKNSL